MARDYTSGRDVVLVCDIIPNMDKPKIVSDPNILFGKPTIAGTRISVEVILDRIGSGMSPKEVLKDYPHLTYEQIEAALAYAGKVMSIKVRVKSNQKQTQPTVLYTHEISR